jgi:phage terminase large subunit-like protein
MFVISTAGFNSDTEYFKLCAYSKKVLAGAIDDPSIFSALYTLDTDEIYNGDLYDNIKYIQKANPMLGVSVQADTIRQELQTAKYSESERTSILTKHLNVFHKKNEQDAFVQDRYVQRSMVDISLDSPEFRGLPVWVGCDLSENDDISCVSYMLIKDNLYYFFNDFFICREALTTKRNREKYREANEKGYINIQEGNAIDYDEIIASIHRRNTTNPIRLIAYDKYRAADFVKKLNRLNYNLLAFSQLPSSMHRPLSEIQRLFLLNKIRLQRNTLTSWMFSNVIIKPSFTGLVTVDKSNSDSNKIDVVPAMADALGGQLLAPEYGVKVF